MWAPRWSRDWTGGPRVLYSEAVSQRPRHDGPHQVYAHEVTLSVHHRNLGDSVALHDFGKLADTVTRRCHYRHSVDVGVHPILESRSGE